MSFNMMIFNIILMLSLSWLVACSAPSYDGFDIVWQDSFEGSAGSLPDTSKWIMQDWYKDLNGDWQTYTTSHKNQQLSGDGSLLIIPLRDSSAAKGWTSGRLESAYTFTPTSGARTIAEASLRLGSAPASGKQGIWPAFWLLGDSHRKGTLIWPTCGEIDIMENVNGETKTQGVIHCDKNPGGICDEKNGIAGAIELPDAGEGFHTYTAVIDRTPGNWKEESVSFYLDGHQYHQVTGDRIGNEQVWGKIAHNLIHFILNVAVGGEWPGDPDESTLDGLDNAMEVKYVAHYESTSSGRAPKHQGIESGQNEYGYDHVSEPNFPQSPPRVPDSTRPHPSPDYFDSPPLSPPQDESLYVYEVPGRPGVYSIPGVSSFREVRPGVYKTGRKTYKIPDLPGLREIPGNPGMYQVSDSHGSHGSTDSGSPEFPTHSKLPTSKWPSWGPGYSDPLETPTHRNFPNFPAPEIPPQEPDYGTPQFPSYPQSDSSSDSIDSPDYPDSDPVELPTHDNLPDTEMPSRRPDYETSPYSSRPRPESSSDSHGSYSYPDYSDPIEKPTHGNFPDTEQPSGRPDYETSPLSSHPRPRPESRPAPVPGRMTDADRQNNPLPMYPTRGRYGSSQQTHESPSRSKGDFTDAASQYVHGSQNNPECSAPSASSPYHGSYGLPGGWGPGTGKECPDGVGSNAGDLRGRLNARHISFPGHKEEIESEIDSESSKPSMPYRFKTPGYPPAPGPDAIAPPTVAHGEFGGVQAKDKSKYLDRSNVARDMSFRFKIPGYPPAPAPDAVAPPTVTPGEFDGGSLDHKNVARDMPYRFKTPGYPPAPAPDAVAPPVVTPGEFGGVQAKDKGKYLNPRGLNGTTPISSQGTPSYGVSKEDSMIAMVSAVAALLLLY